MPFKATLGAYEFEALAAKHGNLSAAKLREVAQCVCVEQERVAALPERVRMKVEAMRQGPAYASYRRAVATIPGIAAAATVELESGHRWTGQEVDILHYQVIRNALSLRLPMDAAFRATAETWEKICALSEAEVDCLPDPASRAEMRLLRARRADALERDVLFSVTDADLDSLPQDDLRQLAREIRKRRGHKDTHLLIDEAEDHALADRIVEADDVDDDDADDDALVRFEDMGAYFQLVLPATVAVLETDGTRLRLDHRTVVRLPCRVVATDAVRRRSANTLTLKLLKLHAHRAFMTDLGMTAAHRGYVPPFGDTFADLADASLPS